MQLCRLYRDLPERHREPSGPLHTPPDLRPAMPAHPILRIYSPAATHFPRCYTGHPSPPGQSARTVRQDSPPAQSASPVRQDSPPAQSASPVRQPSPPAQSARTVRQDSPPGQSASPVRQPSPPGQSASPVRQDNVYIVGTEKKQEKKIKKNKKKC